MNNTAERVGNNVYGGWIDWTVNRTHNIMTYYPSKISKSLEFMHDDPEITSDPIRICTCTNGFPNCNITNLQISIYPGETINIPLVAVGQRNSIQVAHAAAEVLQNNYEQRILGRINYLQIIQTLQQSCSTLNYTVTSMNSEEKLRITVLKEKKFKTDYESYVFSMNTSLFQEYPHKLRLLFTQLIIELKFKHCPLIFTLDRDKHACICPPSLKSLGLQCDYCNNEYVILKSEQQWVGVTYDHAMPNENPGLIAHPHCPHDYCTRNTKIQLEHQYDMCAFNRSGILCGGCQPNYSRVLGSSKCKKCSNIMLLAIIPSSLLAGVLLIIFLMVLNLTVSVGTINGLIFYANIIWAQHSIFFTQETSNSFLSLLHCLT